MEAHLSSSTIDIAGIEERLKEGRSREGATTATTMNLVVYIDDRSQHDRALKRAEDFCEKYPARVLIVDATRKTSANVESCARDAKGATISTERTRGTTPCRLGTGRNHRQSKPREMFPTATKCIIYRREGRMGQQLRGPMSTN